MLGTVVDFDFVEVTKEKWFDEDEIVKTELINKEERKLCKYFGHFVLEEIVDF